MLSVHRTPPLLARGQSLAVVRLRRRTCCYRTILQSFGVRYRDSYRFVNRNPLKESESLGKGNVRGGQIFSNRFALPSSISSFSESGQSKASILSTAFQSPRVKG